MADFRQVYEKTVAHEGGYVNDPDDRGGETYQGIARRYHPDWIGWQIIDAAKDDTSGNFPNNLSGNAGLTAQVEKFYLDNYWRPARLSQLDQEIAEEIFDTGVNQGLGTAVKYFQKALNALNRNAKDYPDMKVDGGLGPLTIAAYKCLLKTKNRPSRSHSKIIKVLLKLMNYYQMERYVSIIDRDPSQEKFMFGWTERVSS
jgi:lysozyme family protein